MAYLDLWFKINCFPLEYWYVWPVFKGLQSRSISRVAASSVASRHVHQQHPCQGAALLGWIKSVREQAERNWTVGKEWGEDSIWGNNRETVGCLAEIASKLWSFLHWNVTGRILAVCETISSLRDTTLWLFWCWVKFSVKLMYSVFSRV